MGVNRVRLIASVRFVVSRVDDGCSTHVEAIAQRQRRMVQVACCDPPTVEVKGPLNEVVEANGRPKLLQGERKVRVLHLASQGLLQAVSQSSWSIDIPGVARYKERREKRKPLDVVPMRVGNEKVPIDGALA